MDAGGQVYPTPAVADAAKAGDPAIAASQPAGAQAAGGRSLHLPILDDCRGVAIILVILRHCSALLPPAMLSDFDHPWQFLANAFSGKVDLQTIAAFVLFYPAHLGWVALPIFFVVSGFCIHLSYTQTRTPSVKAFYIRRFFRIYPAYLLGLFFFAFFFPVTRLPFNKLTYWAEFGAHLFQFHNWFATSLYTINGSYWTIAIEVQLYLLFPLFLLFARRFSYAWLLVVLAALELSEHSFSGLFCYGHGGFPPPWLMASPFFFCFSWAIGAAMADAYLSGKSFPLAKIHPIVWLIPGLLTGSNRAYEFSFTFFALATAGTIWRYLVSGAGRERKSILGRFVRTTGLYSYSIYLIHSPIMLAVAQVYETHFPGIEKNPFLIYLAGASSWLIFFPISMLMYHWVEKPGIALGKRVLRAWSQPGRSQLNTQPVSAT
jgi:peptidoglycan/LPS O-acetylase OafA/YrhL